MDYFAGLDVSVKETSVCIVDDAGKIVREAPTLGERRHRGSRLCLNMCLPLRGVALNLCPLGERQ
jgi:hypothetical protein